MITYRKINELWVLLGEKHEIRVGPVTVTKRDGGTKVVDVAQVSAPFNSNGRDMVYGYLPDKNGKPMTRPEHQPKSKTTIPEDFQRKLLDDARRMVEKYAACDQCGLNKGDIERKDRRGKYGHVCSECAQVSERNLEFVLCWGDSWNKTG